MIFLNKYKISQSKFQSFWKEWSWFWIYCPAQTLLVLMNWYYQRMVLHSWQAENKRNSKKDIMLDPTLSLNDGGQYCEWTMDSGQNHKGNKPCDLLVHGLATIQKRIKRMLKILYTLRWFVREGCHCPKKPLTPPPSPPPSQLILNIKGPNYVDGLFRKSI